MAKIKAEFLQHYYDEKGIPLRTKLIAYLPKINEFVVLVKPLANFMLSLKIVNRLIGFHPKRKIPGYSKQTLRNWYKKKSGNSGTRAKVYLFADEFTNYQESDIGIKAILLLNRLGYEVEIPQHSESSRTYLSKGLVRDAKKIAIENVLLLKDKVTRDAPLIGLEPSAILTFRDEYPELVNDSLRNDAIQLGSNSLLFEEFFVREMEKGISLRNSSQGK